MDRNKGFWLRDGVIAAAIALVVLFLHYFSNITDDLERRFYDTSSTHIARQAAPNIAIIAIDDDSIANIGRWPWPRDTHAKLINKLAQAQTKAIGYTVFLSEPQTDKGLDYIEQIQAALPETTASHAEFASVQQLIAQARTKLDTDSQLAASIAQAGNVVLPAAFDLQPP